MNTPVTSAPPTGGVASALGGAGLDLPETRISRLVDGALMAFGRAASWLWVVLLGVVVVNVALRYLFDEGRIELEELQWHLNALAFLLAIAYGYRVDAHIRIDLLFTRFPPRRKAWIEFYGTLLLLFPFVFAVLVFSAPFVAHSFGVGEVSPSAGGLPFRWLLKGALPAAFLLLLAAAVSRLSRIWAFLGSASQPEGEGQ